MISSPIIKLVSGNTCNMNCTYCYEKGSPYLTKKFEIMSNEVLEKMTQELLAQDIKYFRFIWHGGEPLVAGIDFFRNALKYQNIHNNNQKIMNVFQSNGTLINEEWCNFFSKNNFLAGISLDGTANIHNSQRPLKTGLPSFSSVLNGINLIQKWNIPLAVVCTITEKSPSPKELLSFFLSLGIKNIHFKPREGIKSEDASLQPEIYTKFMINLFDLILELDDPEIDIITITSFALGVLGGKPILCEHIDNCSSYLTFDWDGTVRPCDLIFNTPSFGNILKTSLKEILQGAQYIQFEKRSKNVSQLCRKCKWYGKGCMGGCTREVNNFDYYGYRLPDNFCQSRQNILSYMSAKITNLKEFF